MNKEIVNFFKYMGFYDEKYFKLIDKNTTIINKPYEEVIDFIGVYKKGDGKDFKIYLPELNSIRDYLIHVHEYCHALFLDDDDEIFPNIMEVYFLKYYINDKDMVEDIINYTNYEINLSKSNNHSLAKKIKLKELINYKNELY